jgi:hypothetical protein
VPLLLTLMTAAELLAGGLSLAGTLVLAWRGDASLALAGTALSGISLLMLFFGQRVAKDYPGAAVIAAYFLVAVFALYLFHVPV